MTLRLTPDPFPLRMHEQGSIRVGHTRTTLDFIVEAFHFGYDPEEIAARFPTLELPDVYTALGYYLRHRAEVDAYLAERDQAAAALQAEYEARWPPGTLRAELEARRQPGKV